MSTEDMRARWRPVFAFVFTACFAVLVAAIALLLVVAAFLPGATAALGRLVELTPLLVFLFGSGFGVLGVQVWGRTAEKNAGKASPEPAGPFAAGGRAG